MGTQSNARIQKVKVAVTTARYYIGCMARYHLSLTQKSLLYASKIFIGALACWGILLLVGISNPLWAIITVVLVSDPDLSTARTLVIARVINTIVGCTVGFATLASFGFTLPVAIATITLLVLLITSIENYPANWRLAPVTVLILLDASRVAATTQQEVHFALLRAIEIGVGSLVALVLALLYTRLFSAPKAVLPTSNE